MISTYIVTAMMVISVIGISIMLMIIIPKIEPNFTPDEGKDENYPD